ncbi:MAG TPA: SDR family oxidoreductase [Polyangiaceae bacterium]|jgi:NAD(P)-dependent dehydrogenase (short-subunit alcohol dehydrogenase family)
MSGVAIVTGATRGIGFALAEAMLAEGTTVYAVGLDPARVAEMGARLAHPRFHARRADVADLAAVEALFHEVHRAHGRIDCVVNNAGLLAGGELADMGDAQLRKLVDVNLWGVIHGSRLAASLMRRQRAGTIVNVASMAGVFPVPFSAVYTATKHAVFGFSLALREELAPHGVGVHVVCPDIVDTSIFDRALDTSGYSYRAAVTRHIGRAITAEEAARHVLTGLRRGRAVIYTPPRSSLLGAVGKMFPTFIARQVASRMAPAAAPAASTPTRSSE